EGFLQQALGPAQPAVRLRQLLRAFIHTLAQQSRLVCFHDFQNWTLFPRRNENCQACPKVAGPARRASGTASPTRSAPRVHRRTAPIVVPPLISSNPIG